MSRTAFYKKDEYARVVGRQCEWGVVTVEDDSGAVNTKVKYDKNIAEEDNSMGWG